MMELMQLVRRTLTNPVEVAQELKGMQFSRNTLWLAFPAVVCLSVLLFFMASSIVPVPESQPVAHLSPFMLAAILGSVLILMVFAIHYVGRMLGGTGDFPSAVLMMIWIQVMAFALQIVQLAVFFVLPPLLPFVSLLSTLFLFVILLQFVRVLHEFSNVFMSVATVGLAFLAMIFGLAIVASVVGMTGAGL